MSSTVLYLGLLAAVSLERVAELWLSVRNRRLALERGGVESGKAHYRWMVAIHTAFLISCAVEVVLFGRPFLAPLGLPMLGLVAVAMALRYWAIVTLGDRWNTRVVTVEGEPLVSGGPYRFARHPNYVAVVVEILALPLVHSAWLTAIVFTLANALVLRVRISVEERALGITVDSDPSGDAGGSGSS